MNKLIEWSEELSVGIQEIDEQHKMLIELVNRLNDALLERSGAEGTHRILSELDEYTRIHFAVEESLMRILEFPDYEQHRHEHAVLLDQLDDLQKKLDAGTHEISFELLHFLKIWLSRHIMDSDKRYAPHFLGRGVKPASKDKSQVKRLWGPTMKIARFHR